MAYPGHPYTYRVYRLYGMVRIHPLYANFDNITFEIDIP